MGATILADDSMYCIHSPHLRAYLTWDEKGNRGVLAFTSSAKAEEYIAELEFADQWHIQKISPRNAESWVGKLARLGVNLVFINVPPEHATNPEAAWEEVRNYTIVQIDKMLAQWRS